MMSRPRSSLRTSLKLWILGFAASAIVFSFLFLLKYADSEVERQLQMSKDLVQLYADDSIAIEYGRSNLVYVDDSLRRLNKTLNSRKIRIRDNSGTITVSTDRSELGSLAKTSQSRLQILTASVREHSSHELLGTIEVVVNRRDLILGAIEKAIRPALLLFLGLFLLSVFTIRSFQRRLIQPVQKLMDPSENDAIEQQATTWPSEIYDLYVRLQNAMKQRDLAIVGQFCSGIMHDVRTPLQSIVTAMHLVEKCPPGDLKRASRLENLQAMCRENLPIIGRIIETTLDGSRQIQISKSDTDLSVTIQDAVKLNQSLLDLRKAIVNVQTSGMPSVQHDRTQIARVLGNLIKNGIEAVSEVSKTPQINVVVDQTNPSEVAVSVEDNGPGLAVTGEHVFHVFRSSKLHGSGLGLHISRKIVEAHDGSIRASNQSSLGGARFEFSLPIKPEAKLEMLR